MANAETAIVVFDGDVGGTTEGVTSVESVVESGVESTTEGVTSVESVVESVKKKQFVILPIPKPAFGDISISTTWNVTNRKYHTVLRINCSEDECTDETRVLSSENITVFSQVGTLISVVINALGKISQNLHNELLMEFSRQLTINKDNRDFRSLKTTIQTAMILKPYMPENNFSKDLPPYVTTIHDYLTGFVFTSMMPREVEKIMKVENQHILSFFHSMQSNNEDNLTFKLNFEEGDMKELRDKLYKFNTKGPYNLGSGTSILDLNDSHLQQLLKLLAKSIRVQHGYTGNNREIPIPDDHYMNMEFSSETCILSNGIYSFETPLDVIGYFMFRSIGCKISGAKLLTLFAHMYYSDTIKLHDDVSNVFKFLLSTPYAVKMLKPALAICPSVLWWNTREQLINDDNRFTFMPNVLTIDTMAMFATLFTRWLKHSNLKDVPAILVASVFGIGHSFALNILGDIPLKTLFSRNFNDFQKTTQAIIYNEMDPSDDTFKTGIFEFNTDALSHLLELHPSLSEVVIRESHRQFVVLIESSKIVRKECLYCCTTFEKNIHLNWKTIDCASCPTKPVLCHDCYQRAEYNVRQESGTKLNLSRIVCPQCSDVFPSALNLFPAGTETSDIKDRSMEFFMCCGPRCPHFVRQQIVDPENPTAPVACAAYPDRVMNLFCETHISLSLLTEEKMKECPQCHVMINKSEGCNHMKCACGCEFCFCEGCDYIKPSDSNYTHPFYCRNGITNETTVNVLEEIARDIVSQNGVIIGPLQELINRRLVAIVFEGLDEPLRSAIYHLIDYISDNVQDMSGLNIILRQIENGCSALFGIRIRFPVIEITDDWDFGRQRLLVQTPFGN